VSAWASALYFGTVTHRRLRPKRHHLSYRVFSMLIDINELPTLSRTLRLFSHNRFNLFGFYDRDHGVGAGNLRAHVEAQLAEAGIDLDGGPIRLLCNPRMLGYAFNPLSVYFCHRADGGLGAILYEVHNTFGERHGYLIPVTAQTGSTISQSCDKNFYVSPFLAVEGRYGFRIMPPGRTVVVHIDHFDEEGLLLQASFVGDRVPLSDKSLIAAFVRYPLVTLKVIAGIHWEALKLWRKGVALHDRPPPPAHPVTIVPLSDNQKTMPHVTARI
jgi:DUF1365 family protein